MIIVEARYLLGQKVREKVVARRVIDLIGQEVL
jgi:hypothetical protein